MSNFSKIRKDWGYRGQGFNPQCHEKKFPYSVCGLGGKGDSFGLAVSGSLPRTGPQHQPTQCIKEEAEGTALASGQLLATQPQVGFGPCARWGRGTALSLPLSLLPPPPARALGYLSPWWAQEDSGYTG